MKEITLGIIKPDAVKNKHIGNIIAKIENSPLFIKKLKMTVLSAETLEILYKEHLGKLFLPGLIAYMSSGPVVLMIIEGEEAIKTLREICGHTDPKKAQPGTIRYEYGDILPNNAIHASDSLDSANREIKLLFNCGGL